MNSNVDWDVSDDASWLTETETNTSAISVSYNANITVTGTGGLTEGSKAQVMYSSNSSAVIAGLVVNEIPVILLMLTDPLMASAP